ncbi:hypothetical protein PR003_g10910 [Phytophthora rubi]|uniref:Uncharacterized protein n=1 Tax=Phytophthora rubi TaxID=129364 RepID=A0A6A3MPH4_9STRA|nr:hypothetical protein PR001_g9513 [Phytophthora rubi]KAE9339644.1 hypothetical protein PR003_g10910 [Phytophthora rubi]
MADPAWGTSTLSDEETARALCAFHQTEPLPTQRRRPLQHQQQPQQQQQQAPLYRARDERSHEMPQLAPGARTGGGFSAFGYPLSGSYHMVPMSAPRNEAASMFEGMHGPSTSSDDWQLQQQRRIQEELEQQQRDLQALTQRQQQQDLQLQLQHFQAQIQQQQEQAHRRVERIPEPSYSSGLGGFEQTPWSNDAHTSFVSASSFAGGDSGRNQVQRGAQMQQNGRFFDGGFQRAQPVPIKPATTPTGPRSYAYSHEESSQPGMSTNRDDELFAPQQPAQSHFQERNTDIFGASTLQSWGRSESTSLTGMQADRTKSFQMQNEQRFVPQQQQPQPYYPAEPCERKYQDTATRGHASRSVPDISFVDGVMRHFPTTAETIGDVPTRTARSNDVNVEARSKFEFAPTQYRTQPGLPTQMEVQSRTTVPPTGAVIIPGVSLASPPIRLVTMRDLLNGEEAKADKSRGRPRDNQQRAPQKRKAPKKKAPAKRQRMPQQQNEQRPRQLQMNRILVSQGRTRQFRKLRNRNYLFLQLSLLLIKPATGL